MDFDDEESGFGSFLPPALVSLTPSVSPSPRRLSSCFTQPSKPVWAKRQLAWFSLQGRLVGAEEASSAKTIDRDGKLSAKEAAAWELFTPIQRVLIVAVVAVAAMNSKKNHQISKLQKSVELRDRVLSSMQQKLDSLCEQMNYYPKEQPEFMHVTDISVTKRTDYVCKQCQYREFPPNYILDHSSVKVLNEDEVFKYKTPVISVAEPDERRMSDLSDWAPSVSSIDQLDISSNEHDINSLQKQCEEKDATIKKFSAILQSTEVQGSKRVVELEDIIRRKNMIINKLHKDILVLEQKVISLTRMRRPSFSAASANVKQIPVMADNVLYDMDSTTSPSSSDSDTSACQNQISRPNSKNSPFVEQNQRSCIASTLKERSLNQTTPNSFPGLKPKRVLNTSGENRMRRRIVKSKELAATAGKRWV